MVHSDLGKVIREIIDEFRRNPPLILAMTSAQWVIFCSIVFIIIIVIPKVQLCYHRNKNILKIRNYIWNGSYYSGCCLEKVMQKATALKHWVINSRQRKGFVVYLIIFIIKTAYIEM